MHSAIYTGKVRHRRFSPRQHKFEYSVFMPYLDLDELDDVLNRTRLWSSKGRALAYFRREDYFGDPSIPLKTAVIQFIKQREPSCDISRVCMLSNLRYFGFCFNPITNYYCFDKNDHLIYINSYLKLYYKIVKIYIFFCNIAYKNIHARH